LEDKKLTEKSIENLLLEPELVALRMSLNDPGWEAQKKLAKAIREDWADKVTRIDYRNVQDDVTIKDLIYKQGMLYGIDMFIAYLQAKHDKWKKEEKE
jgi:hypothetical protein